MRLFVYIPLIPAFFCLSARSQQLPGNDPEIPSNTPTLNEVNETGILYKYEMTFGILAHSNGFGLNYRRGRHITGYKKRIFEIEAVNIRHPKEYKGYNPSRENAKGYIFGKMNSFLVLRSGIGTQKVITGKSNSGGVELRYIYFGGISLGLLKPVYLEILKEKGQGNYDIIVEQYDPAKHSTYNINGKAPYLKGLDELKIIPGIYGKCGLSFEYGGEMTKIRSIEVGAAFDLFYKRVPIMAARINGDDFDPNKEYFLSLYLSLNFGKKW